MLFRFPRGSGGGGGGTPAGSGGTSDGHKHYIGKVVYPEKDKPKPQKPSYQAPVYDTGPGVFNGANTNMNNAWKKKPKRYATGGYTGAWGSEGRLAILDEKELVLNKHDTSNLLNAINTMRNIVSNLGENAFAKTSELIANIGIGKAPMTDNTIEQKVFIDAKFEGQTSADQITTALDNLVNIASQRANRNKK